MAIFDVMDFGAAGNGVADDRPAIAAAIAAADAAGGGTVYLPPGVYSVTGTGVSSQGAIELHDNITLQGAGMGLSVIKLADDQNSMSGIVRTPPGSPNHDVMVLDLTIDGNRANQTLQQNGFYCGVTPGSPLYDEDITLRGVEIKACTGYGFDPHEITKNLLIEDCVARGNKLEGFTLDFQVDAIVRNSVAYDNDVHGFLICTNSDNVLIEDCEAYGNGSSGLATGSDSANIEVQGGSFHDNSGPGIYLRDASHIVIENAEIYGNERNGIAVAGVDDVVIRGNLISDNSLAGSEKHSQIYLTDWTDQVTGEVIGATRVVIEDNTIIATGPILPRWGIEERGILSDGNFETGNTISGFIRGPTQFRPDVTDPIDDTAAVAGAAFSYVLSAGTFIDHDPGDTLTWKATRADGSALPSWLSFNQTTHMFSGVPPVDDVGVLSIKVTARDGMSAEISDVFDIGITSASAPPVAFDDDWIISTGTYARIAGPLLTANDTDSNGDALTIAAVGGAIGGQVGLLADGTVTFKASAAGQAKFNHTVSDGNGGFDVSSVAVTVVSTSAAADTLVLATPLGTSSFVDGSGGNDSLTGGPGYDVLTGGDGNDRLDGKGGADLLSGGIGDDTFYVGTSGDVVVEWFAGGFGGTDTVVSSVDHTLAQNVEKLVLVRQAAKGVGNNLANTITGNEYANRLDGGAGDDMLNGADGDDILTGGAGKDNFKFVGHWGSDTVTDFTDGIDRLDFRDSSLEFDDLTIGSSGGAATVAFASDVITLNGMADKLDEGDFLFA